MAAELERIAKKESGGEPLNVITTKKGEAPGMVASSIAYAPLLLVITSTCHT